MTRVRQHNKTLANRSGHCIRKGWEVRRRHDRINKLHWHERNQPADLPYFPAENDDEEYVDDSPYAPVDDAHAPYVTPLEEIPLLVLPPPIKRQGAVGSLFPLRFERGVSFELA